MGQVASLFIEYIAPSTNAMYAGQHWTARKKHKAAADTAVMIALHSGKPKYKFINPVMIEIQPVLGKGKRGYDVSNYSYTFKLIEDCLVARGVLRGDTPDFVKAVRFSSPERGEKTGVKIVISEYPEISNA